MQSSFVLKKIRAGGTITTAKSRHTDPDLVEKIASSGFDAIWIRLEHKRVDGDKESFMDNAAANALLTREYRAPFVVPKVGEI